MESKVREKYNRIEKGIIVAFNVVDSEASLSGKVEEIIYTKTNIETENDSGVFYRIITKNGNEVIIKLEDVIWVYTNGRWPKFVMEKFRNSGEHNEKESKN